MPLKNNLQATELSEQITVIEFCDLFGIPVVHIANEGKRSVAGGAILKRAGLRKGFPDLFVPVACKGYHGLFIEMKTKTGKATAEQIEWLRKLDTNGYFCAVCHGSDQAIELITKYIENERSDKNGRIHEHIRGV